MDVPIDVPAPGGLPLDNTRLARSQQVGVVARSWYASVMDQPSCA